jgi:hypothetical protein
MKRARAKIVRPAGAGVAAMAEVEAVGDIVAAAAVAVAVGIAAVVVAEAVVAAAADVAVAVDTVAANAATGNPGCGLSRAKHFQSAVPVDPGPRFCFFRSPPNYFFSGLRS